MIIIRKHPQENYQEDSQPKFYKDSQIRNMKDKERKNRKKTSNDGKIPWDKES